MAGPASSTAVATALTAAFSPSGALFTGDGCGTLQIWKDLSAQKNATKDNGVLIKAHAGPIYAIEFPKNGLVITAGDEDIRVWNQEALMKEKEGKSSCKPRAVLKNPQASGPRGFVMGASETNAIACTSDGLHMYAASGDGNLYKWDVSSGKCVAKLSGHTDIVHCASVSTQSLLCSGSEDGTVRGWDTRTDKQAFILNPLEGKETAGDEKVGSWINCLATDSSGNWMACGGGDSYIALWHLGSRRVTTTMPTAGQPQAVTFFKNKVISAGNESCVYHWRNLGELEKTVQCKSKSIFSISINRANNVNQLVAAGYPYVELFLGHISVTRSWTMGS